MKLVTECPHCDADLTGQWIGFDGYIAEDGDVIFCAVCPACDRPAAEGVEGDYLE